MHFIQQRRNVWMVASLSNTQHKELHCAQEAWRVTVTSCRFSAPRTAAVQTSLWSCSVQEPHRGSSLSGSFCRSTSPEQQTWVDYDINKLTEIFAPFPFSLESVAPCGIFVLFVSGCLADRYGLTSSLQNKSAPPPPHMFQRWYKK